MDKPNSKAGTATSYHNKELNRIEISFPTPPGSTTKRGMQKRGFEYDPKTRRWSGPVSDPYVADRILFDYESEIRYEEAIKVQNEQLLADQEPSKAA